MSDAVSNAENDDVLNAIRRLVSETHSSKPEGAASTSSPVKVRSLTTIKAKANDAAGEKSALVLTPSFRVSKDEADESSVEASVDEYVEDEMPAEQVDPETSDRIASYFDAANAEAEEEAEPELSPLQARIAELELALSEKKTLEEFEAENASLEVGAETFEEAEEPVEATAYADYYEDELTETEAEHEPAISEVQAEVEADGSYEDEFTENYDHIEEADASDFVETDSRLAARAVMSDDYTSPAYDDEDEEDDTSLTPYDDAMSFDEEALRDMIAEVMREELQGEMGERITRNLRRLVRREVQRAITLREFD